MNLKTHPTRLRRLLTGGLFATLAPGVIAQPTAPANQTPAPAAQTETVVLNEFRVDASQDRGYTATNSITGTLLNTPLRDTPFAIDVFTSQFIEDLGAATFREVLQYDTSAVLDNTIVQGFNSGGLEQGDNISNSETDVKVRGFPVPTLTNGFRTQVSIDTIGLGRIERAGGPSSLLYGTGAISGITNNITKTSLPQPYYFGSIALGSDNYFRAAFDAGGPITRETIEGMNKLGYRVFGSWNQEESQKEFYKDERSFVGAVFDYRPFRSTEVVLDFNMTKRRVEGTGPTDTTGGVDPETGRNVTLFGDIFQQGRNVNFGGPDAYTDYTSKTYRAEIVQRLGRNFTLLVAGQRENFDQERRSIENIDYTIDNGTVARYAWNRDNTDREVDQFRANLLTKFDFFGKHAFVVGRQEYSETVKEDVFQPWFRNYPTSSVFPELNTRPDGTNPMLGTTTLAPNARIRYAGETYVPPNALQTLQQWISGTYLIHQGRFINDRLTTVVGYRWERTHNLRLHTAAPNHYNTRSQNDRIWARRSAADPDDGGMVFDPLTSRGTTRDGYSNKGEPLEGEYPTASASFRITDSLSIYGQYAEGAALPSTAQRDGNGNNFPPNESKAEEIGLKFEFLDGKISGRVAAFRLERLNAVRYGFSLPAPYRGTFNPNLPASYNISTGQAGNPAGSVTLEARTYLWDNTADRAALIAWHDADRLRGGGGLGFAGGNNGHGNRGSYANFDEQAEGVELQLDFKPTPAWSIRTSYTRNDVIVTRGISNLANQDQEGGFFSPFHPAFTTLGEANFTNGPVQGNLASYTTNVRTSSFVDGQYGDFKKSDTPLHAFTLWNKYDLQNDMLRGFSVGGGARYQSERTTDFGHGRNDRPQESREDRGDFVTPPIPESWLFDLYLGYNRRIGGRPWSFQLNVRNLLDDQKLQAIGLPPEGSGITVPRTATVYLEPRDIRFTASVRF